MPLTPEEFSHVAAHIGAAVWQIQVLEETVALHLVLVHKVDAKTARRDIEAMFAKASKQTLGQLLRGIRDSQKNPSDLLALLETFVHERNWFIHHSREKRKDLDSDKKRAQFVARIEALAADALSLMTRFQDLTETHLIARGFDRAKIKARANQIYREWNTET
ncbi:MAG TPA: hypothetical protein VFA51_09565 [Candidatus Udaeobacter sp.]|nr:hypothetical protein [Candidatus Udaeobacter sp.]